MRTRRLGKPFSGGNEKRRDVATESLSIQLFMDRPSTVRARFIVSSFFQVTKMTVLSVLECAKPSTRSGPPYPSAVSSRESEADGVQHGMSSNERAKYRQGEDERGPHIPQEIHCEGTSTTHYCLIATAYNIIGRSVLKETPLGGRIPQQQSRDMPTS